MEFKKSGGRGVDRILNRVSERGNLLSETESRILVGLLQEGSKSSQAEILRIAEISNSTWNKEKRLLELDGLIVPVDVKSFTEDGVARKVNFSLTERGKHVAQILLAISQLIT